jgi:S-sulfosulfanyl-L-cysteine sulfohydrolase
LFSPAFAETPGQQESRQPPTASLGEICAAKVADIQSILTGLMLERLSIYSGQVRGLLAAGVERGQMIKSWTRREVVTSVGVAAIGSSVSLPKLTSAGSSPEQAKEGKRLTLLHFTDTHAQLETHPEYLPGATPEIQMMGGYARLKTAIERERGQCEGPCFLLDGGDEFQGSGPAVWSEGEVVLEPLKSLGIDVFTPGNWDPAYGPERFKQTMARLDCPVVCYNFHDIATGERLFPASITFERQGVKIVVVGLTDIGASERQPPAEFRGMDTSRIEGLRDFVNELRGGEQPDLVVGLTHTGLTIAREIARRTPEFDVILSGHTHERTARPIVEGEVIVVEPGSFGSFLGRLDLTIKPGGGIANHHFQLIPILASRYDEDPEVKDLVEKSLSLHRPRMAKWIGKTETVLMRYDLLETTADNFIADAVRETAKTDIGFTNGFRFGVPVLPQNVTEADLWNLLPMDARMKRGWVTGKELKDYLERELEMVYAKNPLKLNGGWGPRASGMSFIFQARAEEGRRVVSVKINGIEVEDDVHYTIAGCEREGEPLDVICRHRGSHDARILPVSIHEALAQYFQVHPVVAPTREGREKAIDLPSAVFSQDAVLAGGNLSEAPTTPHGIPPG